MRKPTFRVRIETDTGPGYIHPGDTPSGMRLARVPDGAAERTKEEWEEFFLLTDAAAILDGREPMCTLYREDMHFEPA